jgi:hypothetical protein
MRGGWLRPVFISGLLAFVCAFSAFSLDAAAYRRDFAANWKEAETCAREIRPLLELALDDPFLAAVGIAVVFPELSRYSYIRDAAETSLLELFYIMNGSGNFSIGKFQMKPSFAAMIERDADGECRLRYPALFETGTTDRQTRILRIERLKTLERQAEYFAVFLRLMDKRFPGLRETPHRMVRIFSSAYNAGYDKSPEQLAALSGIRSFPYGSFGIREQYSYCEIALDYYKGLVP